MTVCTKTILSMQENINEIYQRFFDNKLETQKSESLYCALIQLEKKANLNNIQLQYDKKLRKKIFTECKPSIDLCKHLNIPNLEFITNEKKHYDAMFFFQDQCVEVECVSAINWQELAINKEHMSMYGVSPVLTSINKTEGSRHKRTIHKTPIISLSEDQALSAITNKLLPFVSTSLEKKVILQKRKGLYRNTILLILYEDHQYILDSDKLTPYLEHIATSLYTVEHQFKGVYLIGVSGRVTPILSLSLIIKVAECNTPEA